MEWAVFAAVLLIIWGIWAIVFELQKISKQLNSHDWNAWRRHRQLLDQMRDPTHDYFDESEKEGV